MKKLGLFALTLLTTASALASYRPAHFDRITKVDFATYSDGSLRGSVKLDFSVRACGNFISRHRPDRSYSLSPESVYAVEVLGEDLAGPQGGCEGPMTIDFYFPDIDLEGGKYLVIRLLNPPRMIDGQETIHEIFIRAGKTAGDLDVSTKSN